MRPTIVVGQRCKFCRLTIGAVKWCPARGATEAMGNDGKFPPCVPEDGGAKLVRQMSEGIAKRARFGSRKRK